MSNLSKDIHILIEDYELEYLQDTYLMIYNKKNEIYEERKKYEESKIYKVKLLHLNYIPGNGRDYFSFCRYFTSLERCEKYIGHCSNVGVIVYSAPGRHWSHEDTNIKFEILCKNKIIKIIGEDVYKKHEEAILICEICDHPPLKI